MTDKDFIPLGNCVSQFWLAHNQEFPILSDLAARILNIPTSSSIIERTFSKISRFCTKERNSIKSATLATFVQFNEFQEFEPSLIFLRKKYNLPYEPISWVANEDEFESIIPNYIDGLIDENSLNHSDSSDTM